MLSDCVDLSRLIPSPEAVACVPEATARRLGIVPLGLVEGHADRQLLVACADPDNTTKLQRLSRQLSTDCSVLALPVAIDDLQSALDKCYSPALEFEDSLRRCRSQAEAEQLMHSRPGFLVQLLENLLLLSCRLGASDIHLSPERYTLVIRLRLDGVMQTRAIVSKAVHSGLLVRIKVLAAMDIAEVRKPQDGQFSQLIDGHDFDFRISTFPTTHGENTVIRVLDSYQQRDSLASLLLPADIEQTLKRLLQRPDGLVLVCGPTGSGKSTTLHAMLRERNAEELNIMTLEDPVELSASGIRQSTIDADHSLDYAEGVRALLRQDPDVLLVGEIRDSQSCAMALRAVMSGHQVLTTVHANSALAGLTRLRELGAPPALLADNLVAVASQRLIRICCGHCDDRYDAKSLMLCPSCHGSGFHGRQAVIELLVVTPELARLIVSGANQEELLHCALRDGFVPLLEQGQRLIDQHLTTASELERVLGRQDPSLSAPDTTRR